ncbi:MAG: response regulator transcription factor [Chloroflexota bacterium]|nr:response regulator transcription factor [Chloroflexota bacterium]
MIRVLVVSPYPTVRAGLRALVEQPGDLEAVDGELVASPSTPSARSADVAPVDGEVGAAAISSLAAARPELAIVVLGGEMVGDLGSHPAPRGYLRRDATQEEVLSAVRTVANGLTVVDPARLQELLATSERRRTAPMASGETLTPRELEVLQLIADGLPNKTIATQLGISEHTAKFHVSSVLAKLGAFSRTEAVSTAARRGLLVL